MAITGKADLKYTIGADASKYERTMASVTSIAKKSGKNIAAAFVVAGAAAAAAAASGLKSYIELDRKLRRTEAIIRATGNAAKLSSRELLDFANQLDLATLGNRDQILGAINAMQTFRSVTGDTFKRSIEIAQDLSEVLGTDVRSSAVMLGKALEDPVAGINAMRRVGVSFSQEQKDVIRTLVETGQAAEAQGKILDTLAGQVGGAARGAAGGLAGQVDTLEFRWREFRETIGSSRSVIIGTSNAINTMSNALKSLSKWIAGPTIVEQLQKTISEIEPILAKQAGNEAFLTRGAGVLLAKELAYAKQSLAALLEPENFEADYGSTMLQGFGSDKAGGGTGDEEPPAIRAVFGEPGLWEAAAADRYETRSNHLQALIDLDAEHLASAKKMQADFWQWRIQGDMDAAMRTVDIEAWQRDQRKKIGLDTAKNLGRALQLMGQQQRWAFESYKIYATGEAIIAGIDSAVLAWKAGMATGGPWAPAIAAAYAASSLAWTGAQVSAIQSASFGGGTGTAGAPVGTYNANPTLGTYEPEPAIAQQDTRPSLTINIEGDFIGDESYIDNLVEKINQAKDERDVTVNYL